MESTQQTEASLLRFVADIHTREGAAANTRLYRTLIWGFLARVFRASRGYATSWSNTAGGKLTLTGQQAALPADCIAVTRVEWDGEDNPLDQFSVAYFDRRFPGWRTQTGEPSYCAIEGKILWFDSAPFDPITGKLVVRGRAMPTTTDAALLELPLTEQLAPAYEALYRLPLRPGHAEDAARKAEYQPLAAQGFAACVAALGGRELKEFGY